MTFHTSRATLHDIRKDSSMEEHNATAQLTPRMVTEDTVIMLHAAATGMQLNPAYVQDLDDDDLVDMYENLALHVSKHLH